MQIIVCKRCTRTYNDDEVGDKLCYFCRDGESTPAIG